MLKRVDFYLLEQPTFSACLGFAVQLSSKIYAHGQAVQIMTANTADCTAMSGLLWSSVNESFIPHTETTPNILTLAAYQQVPDVLLQLTLGAPVTDSITSRLLQIVPNDPELKQIARDHYRHYKQLGLELHSHNI